MTYVIISSHGRIILDPQQGIEQTDKNDDSAFARTDAYPDQPKISEPIPLYIIAIAVVVGILILLLIVIILWRCGFFKRRRANQPILQQAELQKGIEWSES